MDFSEPGTTVRTMDLTFEDNAGSSELASAHYSSGWWDGKATDLTLQVNLAATARAAPAASPGYPEEKHCNPAGDTL